MNDNGKLTYDELRAIAVSPSEPGAYSGSPLGEDTGVHVHGLDADVHVYVAGYGKIAEVYPDRTRVLVSGTRAPENVARLLARLP